VRSVLDASDTFAPRHLGPRDSDVAAMLATLGLETLDDLVAATIPSAIRLARPLQLDPPHSEREMLRDLQELAARNDVFVSCLGMGYSGTITPRSSCATSWRTRAGTPPTPLTRRRSPRGAWKRC
jgi:glycine dehydrogenase